MNPVETYLRQAEQSCRNHCWDEADRLYRRAVNCDSGPHAPIAYGTFLAERQHFRPAMVQLMQGLDGAQADGDLELQAHIFSNLASIYRELGEHDLAQRFQRQVLAIHDAVDAEDLLNWGNDALLAGNLTLSESLALNALSLVKDSEDIATQATAYGHLGIVAARQGKHRRAARFLIQAARGHQHVGDDQGLGVDFQNLAEVFGLMHRFAWQRSFLALARDCFDYAGMTVSESRAAKRLREVDRLDAYRRMNVGWN